MRKILLPLVLFCLLATTIGLSGCRLIVRPHGRVYVDVSPPPVRVEVRPHRPHGKRWVWIEGHWERRRHRWVWVPGYWKKVPHRHHHWVPGHWEHDGYGWYWVEGYWE